MSFNKITIIGHLGRDPELKQVAGKSVAEFSMATNGSKRGDEDKPIWFKITVWGRQAENCAKYLQKGSQAYVAGRLTLDEWTDKDGNTRTDLKVTADEVQFLQNQSPMAAAAPKQAIETFPASDNKGGFDDVPF